MFVEFFITQSNLHFSEALRLIGIEGRRQLAVTAYCVRSFFDAHLKRLARAPVDLRSPDYPEIEVLE